MKIVITGALGHIGSRMVRELPLAYPGIEIVMIDNMATQRYASLFNLPPEGRFRFIEADVLTMELEPCLEGAHVVLHLAAITDAAGSFEKKAQVEAVNYQATARVAEACANTGCSMIHLSSTSVYGTQAEVVDEACPETELQPQSPYAATKLKEERFLHERGGIRFVICRFGTIAGVSPGMRFHTAVNKFCWQAVLGQPLTVWRTALHQKRPYLDLSDAVGAVKFIIDKSLFDGRVYNVLTDNLAVHDIIELIRRYIPDPVIQSVDTRIMNQLSYTVLNERFKREGFSPRGDLAKAVGETIGLLKGANHDG